MNGLNLAINIRANNAQALAGLNAVNQQAGAMGRAVGGASQAGVAGANQLSVAMRQAGHHMAMMAGDAFLIAKGMQAIRDVLNVGASFESMGAALKFATGSAQVAGEAMTFVRKTSEALGIPLDVSAKAFTKLAASARGTSLEGRGVEAVFTAVASAGRVMGLTSVDMEGALLAVSQMMSKGVVSAEELRGQLGERIPGAFAIAARSIGKTEQEFNKLLETGQILSADFLPKFAAELQRSVSDALPDATKTFASELERLKNKLLEFGNEVAQSGAMDEFTILVRDAAAEINRLAANGELQKYAKEIADLMRDAGAALGGVSRFVLDHRDAVLRVVEAYIALRVILLAKGILNIGAGFAGGAVNALAFAKGMGNAAIAAARVNTALDGVYKAIRLLPAFTLIAIAEEITRKIITVTDDTRKTRAEADAINKRTGDRAEAVALEIQNFLLERPRKLREAAEAVHAGKIKTIKDAELAYLKQVLVSQVQAYDEANKHLEAARKKREGIEQANKDFFSKLRAGPEKPKGELNTIDVAVDTSAARQAIVAGDYAAAGKSIDAAREKILAMKQAGIDAAKALEAAETPEAAFAARAAVNASQSMLVLEGLAREVAGLASQMGKAEEDAASAQVAAIDQAIQDTVKKAEWLKHITIGFDQDAAIQSAEALRAAIQEKLANNPLKLGMVVVQQGEAKADPRIDQMLGIEQKKAAGGLIAGPGSGTSDSILARLSNGEFVMRAAAVKHWGVERLAALNAGRMPANFPGFAAGGLVTRAVASLPRFAEGGPVLSGAGLQPINIILPGGKTLAALANPAEARDFAADLRREAMKRGG